MVLEFFVAGVPIPQGSMRAPRAGVVISDNAKLKPWRRDVAVEAKIAARTSRLPEPSAGPCEVYLTFWMKPPAYVAKRMAREERGHPPCCVRPDVDKLTRAVFDALTDVLWVDDQQVYLVTAVKRYHWPDESSGVFVRVTFPEEDR